ncbi:hypothetical protein CICLE_v10022272mg [Citrus x clementina]|uniref:SHSP domain-containing protein n=1 Tax=Citrus clementina TaxID=85681 RepID=V4U3I3_CITCL|nr:uncharacterized protein LOC18047926 [Citrus x clementina]ESR56701.1 hypothetical protein CICLE_v10022272mg [Citrus x clementina]
METKFSVDEIEPFCKWQKEEQQDVLEVHLQGFHKSQLKVQINNLGELTISGERPLDQENKRVRFRKQINVSKDCKKEEIHAKLSGGILYIMMPKIIPVSLPAQAREQIVNQEKSNNNNGNAKQNDIDHKPAAASATTAGTSRAATWSMMSKLPSTKCISELKCSVPRLQQMDGKTALKLGALAAVMVVAAVGAYAAYKYHRAFHVDD